MLDPKYYQEHEEAVLRWQRNRMGRPLSPPQIHGKNIWTWRKFHRTTSECRQRTSGTQKGSPCLRKEVGQDIKDKKRDKRGRDGGPSWEGSLKKERSFQTPGNFPGGSDGKVSAYNVGDPGSMPGEGNGNPLQYSCLENPMDGGAW